MCWPFAAARRASSTHVIGNGRQYIQCSIYSIISNNSYNYACGQKNSEFVLGNFKMEQLMNFLGVGELYRMDKRQVCFVVYLTDMQITYEIHPHTAFLSSS